MADESKNPGGINSDMGAASTGLNMDNTPNQIGKGSLTYALNALLENFDASGINYQNEPGNEFCLEFPKNYTLIGTHFIQERNKHIFFLANPLTGQSEIGYMDNNDCVYRTLVNDNCLNFDVNNPIPKIVHRVSNCTTEIYWPDQNGRRFLDLDNIPYILSFGSEVCNPVNSSDLDCNQLNINPDFAIPLLRVADVRNGGSITAGTVQFAFQYSDALGNGYTSFYSVTNPTPIADPSITTVNFNYPVGKTVILEVSNIELSGKFQYFNIAVIKTVNDITSVELVGTFFIDDSTKEIIYSGQSKTDERLTINEIFEKFPVYSSADDVTAVSDVLVWKGLSTVERINYQSIASKITLQWETWRIPPGEDYSDELNATNLRGYMRDEVYAFEFVPLLKSGKQCDSFHIPGRMLTPIEQGLPEIPNTDPDYIDDPDKPSAPRWKIYNTAVNRGKVTGYKSDVNYKGPYEYGDFAYWESELEYPCDETIWGELAGQKIRHHKFPDVNISPIFEAKNYAGMQALEMGNTAVFPIGVRIDVGQVKAIIIASDLTDEQKNDIIGFKIVRGNRSTNKSVIAKGILRNVNRYTRAEQTFFFPNYPYNDLDKDPFISAVNNAYRNDCEKFNITVYKFNATDDKGPHVAFQYVECTTNKLKVHKIYKLGTSPLCSIGRPKPLGPGTFNQVVDQTKNGPVYQQPRFGTLYSPNTAVVKYANYDIWRATCDGKCKKPNKWDVVFEDAVAGLQREQVKKNEDYKIHVRAGIAPYKAGVDGDSISKNATLDLIERVRDDDCTKDVPLPGPKTHESMAHRQVFNSPETSFGQPFLGDTLKVESIMFGRGKAHFVQVKDNAKYRLLTFEAQEDALYSAKAVGNITNPNNAAAMFTVYQSYLTIYVNGITKKNYAYSFNSRADYSYNITVPDYMGIKQRRIDLRKYLIPAVQNVGEELTIDGELQNIDINNYQRETSVYLRTELEEDPLPYPDDSINKIKGLFITDNSRFTVGRKETCVDNVCEDGNCSQPEKQQDISVVSYYASMKNSFPTQWGQLYSYETVDTGFQANFTTEVGNLRTIFGGDTFICRFAFKTKVPFFIDNRVGAPDESDIFFDELGNIGYPNYWHSARSVLRDFSVEGLGLMTNIISFKDHWFDCPNSQATKHGDPNRTFYDGFMYLFAYGIPNFYVESSYNVDLRQATNNREGEFWPHVSTGIPDDWVQESFVSIAWDNTYNYNVTYSKQNKENFFSHLPFDYSTKKCYTTYPFRAIYSETETADEGNRMNNWLTYRATSYFDFPQNYGRLTSIDGLENRTLLARFENKSLLYNALYTNQTNQGGRVYLGQPLFTRDSPPLDFAETDLGYVGSQHKFLLKLPYGQITVDAKRGQIFLLQGHQAKDLTGPGTGMNRFFTDHLAFEILRFFPDREVFDEELGERVTIPGVNIDNHFKDIGLHGVFDTKYDRIIITKLDYIPIDPRVQYDSVTKEFYYEEEWEVPAFSTSSTTTSTTTSGGSTTSTSSTSSTSSTTTLVPPTTTTTTTGTRIVKKRIVVSVTDPDFFCNKSWTISYSFITNSWISFHSYLPNWYIGENNFFYSGVSTCCDDDLDFTFIAGTVVPNPSTTTTTSSSTSTTTSTTSTTTTLDCAVTGTITSLNCTLAGEGNVLTLPDPEPCVPSDPNIQMFELYWGYTAYPAITFVDSSVSSAAACNASAVVDADPLNNPVATRLGYATALDLGSIVYDGGANCTFVQNGWYFTDDTPDDGLVYHIVDGMITEVFSCNYTTTTTSTTIDTTPRLTVSLDLDMTTQPDSFIMGIYPGFYLLDSGTNFPVSQGESRQGDITAGGTEFSINYTAYFEPLRLEVYKNHALVFVNNEMPVGFDMFVNVPVNWTSTDSLEIVLK